MEVNGWDVWECINGNLEDMTTEEEYEAYRAAHPDIFLPDAKTLMRMTQKHGTDWEVGSVGSD